MEERIYLILHCIEHLFSLFVVVHCSYIIFPVHLLAYCLNHHVLVERRGRGSRIMEEILPIQSMCPRRLFYCPWCSWCDRDGQEGFH